MTELDADPFTVGAVVRIRWSAGETFGGCKAQVVTRGAMVGVTFLAPNMAEGNGPWMFRPEELSASRDDWDGPL